MEHFFLHTLHIINTLKFILAIIFFRLRSHTWCVIQSESIVGFVLNFNLKIKIHENICTIWAILVLDKTSEMCNYNNNNSIIMLSSKSHILLLQKNKINNNIQPYSKHNNVLNEQIK